MTLLLHIHPLIIYKYISMEDNVMLLSLWVFLVFIYLFIVGIYLYGIFFCSFFLYGQFKKKILNLPCRYFQIDFRT